MFNINKALSLIGIGHNYPPLCGEGTRTIAQLDGKPIKWTCDEEMVLGYMHILA